MKIVCACLLLMGISFIGGCAEPTKVLVEPGIHVETIQPGRPPAVTRYYIPDAIFPTLHAIKQDLEKIYVKVKEVRRDLDVAGKKGSISSDMGIRQKLDEIDLKVKDVRTAVDIVSRIEQKLEEIDFKVKDVRTALDNASKKVPIREDLDIRRALDEIDSKVRDVRTALDVASRRVPISGDVVQIIIYLRPRLNVELDPNVLCSDKKIRMTFNITNRGEHSVSIGDPQLTLSTECIRGKEAEAGRLSPNVDYTLQWESSGSYAAPGQTMRRVADIEIREAEFEGRPLYYSLCIDAETEPEIVEVLSGLLLDTLETDKMYSLLRASFAFAGQVSPSAFRQPE